MVAFRWFLTSISVMLAMYATGMIYISQQQAAELRFFVKVKFNPPPDHLVFIDGEPHTNIVYMNTKYQYNVSYRKGEVIEREFLLQP